MKKKNSIHAKKIEIMDTTPRDGLQSPGIKVSPLEKEQMVRLAIERVGVDRVEIASARVAADRDTVQAIAAWAERAGHADKIEVLTFLDDGKSLQWVGPTGCRTLNLLVKGSERHCRDGLGWNFTQQLAMIRREVEGAVSCGFNVNIYLEHWSDGMRESPVFTMDLLGRLNELPVKRLMLCDTLGILSPREVRHFVRAVRTMVGPERHLDGHFHNDYGLAVANSLEAAAAGCNGLHGSWIGLGERTGNTPLPAMIVGLHDHLGLATSVKEKELAKISGVISAFTRREVAVNEPIVGRDVFTHTAGVHASGEEKNDLYTSQLAAKRFGRQKGQDMGPLGGRASVRQNLKSLGLKLKPVQVKLVENAVVEITDRGRHVSQADLLMIIADVLGQPALVPLRLLEAEVTSVLGQGARIRMKISFQSNEYRIEGTGSGGFDASIDAVANWAKEVQPNLHLPKLQSFQIRVPTTGDPGALVPATAGWENGEGDFSTTGLDSDQVFAAIKGWLDAINLCNYRK
jgi:D-citramalate synthase